MRCFILEDEIHRYPRNAILEVLNGNELTVTVNSFDARKFYKPGQYDYLLLDHDMRGYYDDSEYEDTGYQFCKALVNLELGIVVPKPRVILHSQNEDGRRKMGALLVQHKFSVAEFPFGSAYVAFLKSSFGHNASKSLVPKQLNLG